jgi:hypothetical protein
MTDSMFLQNVGVLSTNLHGAKNQNNITITIIIIIIISAVKTSNLAKYQSFHAATYSKSILNFSPVYTVRLTQ